MNMVPVTSSNLHSIGFDDQTQTLYIRFLDKQGGPGSLYEYYHVLPSVYTEFLRRKQVGESIGKWFDQAVKKAKYEYAKIN